MTGFLAKGIPRLVQVIYHVGIVDILKLSIIEENIVVANKSFYDCSEIRRYNINRYNGGFII